MHAAYQGYKAPYEQVLVLLDQIKAAALKCDMAKVGSVSDELAVFTMSYVLPQPNIDWLGLGARLTTLEARMADRLFSKPGQIITREMFLSAMYFDRPHGEPNDKIVDVKLCHVRKKLKPLGYSIESVFGRGYIGKITKQESIAA